MARFIKTNKLWGNNNLYKRSIFIEDWIDSLPIDSTLLDAGAGPQRYKKYAKHLNYISQDFGSYEGGTDIIGNENSSWNSKECNIISDICAIPLEDESIDYILCSEVFEHLPNPHLALKELARLVRKGGKILVTAPYRCLYHQEPYFFYSGFSKYWYEHFGKENNLKILKIKSNGNYFSELAQEAIRALTFGSKFLKIFGLILTLPYYVYLLLLDKIFKTKKPTSCFGYFVIYEKK